MPTKKKSYRYVRLTCPGCGANIRSSRSITPPICAVCTSAEGDMVPKQALVFFKFNPTPGDAK